MILGWCESVYKREYSACVSVLHCLSILQAFWNRKSAEKYKSATFYFFTTIHFQLQVPNRIEQIWLCFVLPWGGVTPISRLVIENGHSTICIFQTCQRDPSRTRTRVLVCQRCARYDVWRDSNATHATSPTPPRRIRINFNIYNMLSWKADCNSLYLDGMQVSHPSTELVIDKQ
jgi:hypothetical protein